MNVSLIELHDLRCTGSTPPECVCAPPPIRRPSAMERHLQAAAVHRERSEDLVSGIVALMRKLDDLPAIPLDTLERYERAIVKAHAANLLRLPSYNGGDA